LFGDGAGAVVMAPEPRPDRGLLSTHLHTDGTKADILNIPAGGSRKPLDAKGLLAGDQYIKMNGREVYKIAVRALEESSRDALVREVGMTVAFIFPGQGSQSVGMGQALAAVFPEARAALDEADAALGGGLANIIAEGPEDELRKTANTQPAILAVSVAAHRAF